MKLAAIALTSLAFTGCASLKPADLVNPSEVRLEDAMKSVGEGLSKMKDAQGDLRTGLIPTEVEIKFNLAASATEKGKLTVDLSKAIDASPVKKDEKLGGSYEAGADASRGSAIVIKFQNILTLNKDSLAALKSANDVQALLKALEQAGIETFQLKKQLNIQ